jgi:hypothetical protein
MRLTWLVALLLCPLAALAQDVPAGPVADLILAGATASAAVVAVVLFARSFLPWLRQDADRPKAASMALALVAGLALGWFGIAPPMGAGVAGKLVGGLVCAAVASYGRDFFVRGFRAAKPADQQPNPGAQP